jgi:outer membrane protein assembly factor BamB
MSTEVVPVTELPQPARAKKLRIWPAIPLLLYMVAAKIAQPLITEWSRTTFLLVLFGPLYCAIAIFLWWLFASRARWSDRILGFLGMLVLGVAAWFLGDGSMKGMAFVSFTVPNAVIVFTTVLLAFSPFGSRVCTIGALVAGALALGYWDSVRYDGMSGDFKSAIHWRWEKSAEEAFLAELKAQPKAAPAQDSEPLGKITWPQFRGAKRDGSVPGVALDADWSVRKPNQIWKHKVGPAWSSFAVAGNRLFTQEQRGTNEDIVCYDAKTGAERWVHESPARFAEAMGGVGPRATPTLSGGMLYTQGATGLLECLDPLTGASKWQRDLMKEADRKDVPMWGYSSSPLVVGDKVIAYAPAGGGGGGGVSGPGQLFAYDAATGEPRWKADAGGDSYSSPQIAKLAGRDVVLFLANSGLAAVDAKTGKSAWNYEWASQGHRVVQPLLIGDSGVLLGTGMDAGTRRIEVVADKSDVRFENRWTSLAMKPDFNDYVAFDGYLYGLDHNILCCVDLATGEKKWKNGRYGNGQILLLPDAGQLLVLSETGELVLIRANSSKLDEVARQKMLEGKTWNHPVLVGNRVYVRNAEEAACFELPLAGQSSGERTKPAAKEL